MKKVILVLLVVSVNTQARVSKRWLENQVRNVQQAQELNDREMVMSEAQELVLGIHRGLEIGRVKKVVRTKVTEVRKEVVTRSERYHERAGGFAFLGPIAGGARYSHKKRVDYTAIVTANAEEMEAFPRQVERKLRGLKRYLMKYLRDHQTEIIIMKVAAMIYIDSAIEMVDLGRKVYLDDAYQLIQLVQDIEFAGRHEVTTCVKTKYRRTKSVESTNAAAGVFSLFGFGGGVSYSEKKTTVRPARTEQDCTSEIKEMSVGPKDDIYRLNLTQLDRQLNELIDFLEMKLQLQGEGTLFPTFGNPWYE